MKLEEMLLNIEKALWVGGGDPYRRYVDDHCLLGFPEMSGRYSRAEFVAMVGDESQRWRSVDLDVQGRMRPTDDIAVLTYRASALRGKNEHYSALVSSAYVQREGEWKLMFHHQTPLTDLLDGSVRQTEDFSRPADREGR